MSEYELTNLFYEAISLTNMFLMSYMSVLFAFLVAGFFIAHKLQTPMIILLVGLFAVVSFYLMVAMYFAQSDSNYISSVIAAQVEQGEYTLEELGAAKNIPTFWLITQGVAVVGSFAVSLIFFFYQRRIGLNAGRK